MTEEELEDRRLVAELPYNWGLLTNKTLLISGGTGFIGSFFCDVIRYRDAKYSQNIKIVCVSRKKHESDEVVTHISADVCKPICVDGKIDYIIHLASNTHPEQYASDPVGTITGNVFGTYNLLTLGVEKRSRRFLLASSCEIYGDGQKTPVDELYCGYINCNTARAGYNESKRVSESLCQAFWQQHGVPPVIVRLARVYGADRTKNDSKAMAQFLRNAVNAEDIVLKSRGLQRYSYVYIADAVSGILAALLNGRDGEAYNVTDDGCLTLSDYAQFIARLGKGIKVVYEVKDNPNASRAQNALLSNEKIKGIGFKPLYSVEEGLTRTYSILKHGRN